MCAKVLSCTGFRRTFVQTLIAPGVADRSGTKVLSTNFIANPVLQRIHKGSICSDSTFVHYNIRLYKCNTLIEPLCRRWLLLELQIARAQMSHMLTLWQIQSHSVHKGSIWRDSTFVHYNIWLYKYLTLYNIANSKVLPPVVSVHKGSISCSSMSQGSISNTLPTLRRAWRAQRFYLHIFGRIAILSLN